MKVRELIRRLQEIENPEEDVVVQLPRFVTCELVGVVEDESIEAVVLVMEE